MKIDRIHRRAFLTGVGGAALALPFLPSLVGRNGSVAKAAPSVAPRRFVAIKSYSAQNIRDFYPSTAPSGYSLRPYGGDDGANGKDDGTIVLTRDLAETSGRHADGTTYTGKWAPLSDFAGTGVSRVFNADFGPVLAKMLLLRGLDFMPDLNHNDGGMLGNFGYGLAAPSGAQINATIDQVLAYSTKLYPAPPAGARVLHLSGGQRNTFSYAPTNPDDVLATGEGAVEQAQAHVDPRTAFDEAFRSFMPSDAAGPHPNERLVDLVIEDYRRVRDGRRIGAEDRQTLERHMTFLSELQTRLEGSTGGLAAACGEPMAPPSSTVGDVRDTDVEAIRRTYELMIDVAVAALICDVTRIVTLDVFKAVGVAGGVPEGFFHSCDPCALSGPTNWHTHAHDWSNLASREIVSSINEWIAQEVVLSLVQRLDEVMDVDGCTMLDNSLVVWGNELGFNHLDYSVPTAVFGSGGGALETGRYIDYIDWNRPVRFSQHNGMVIEGVPYNRFLVTVLQAMGLEPADYETSPGAGFGELRTLGKPASTHAVDYDMSAAASRLPDI